MDLTGHPGAYRTDANRPSRGGEPPSVRIEIDALVLEGFGHRVDADLVAATFSTELERLLRLRGVPLAAGGGDRELDVLSGLPPLPATTSPDRLGVALARSVHAGLSGRADPSGRANPSGRASLSGRTGPSGRGGQDAPGRYW
jgi:hypothetical protein